jgi:cytochrome c peroxidase
MAATKEHVEAVVNSMPQYTKDFQDAYGKDVNISFTKVTDTIGLFERTLVTPSVYDDYLNGDKNAMTPVQKDGLKTFIQVGCATCHTGIALGGSMNAMNITATYKYQNVGDFKGDKNRMVKVPTLRNITQTAPYFHNGKVETLKEAIAEMARIQLGTKLSDKEVNSINEFMKALDGRKTEVIFPVLPASSATTPKPDLN